ncbi:AEC family transporter [Neisseria animalis]|uniref:AEC family transporter n=1 Tax=Neisseria animalis TaxID=492 RepID=A0A5P3MNT1_NEIAN|nr:AEC family transporter [Neisseria animalis]QEY23203.1 AEC family transporter [Neisseria animalis]ROW31776.1 AEC family transporter [Neisseria animalis]VEE08377.1 auxin efflux carrier [Neisseria animalis]
MTAIFHIIAPVFLAIFVGYAAMRRQFFTQEQLNGLGKFVVRIGMPMLVFNAIATRPMAEVFKPEYFYGYSAASVLAFFIGWQVSRWRKLPPTLAVLNGFAVGMSNSGFIGYPLLLMAIGPSAAVYFAMNVLTESLLIFPLLFAFLDWSKGRGTNARTLLLKIVKNLSGNPIIVAMPVAMVFALGWLPLPLFVEKLSSMLAAATTPLALFMIGGNLYGLSIRGNVGDMMVVAAGKLLMCPLLVGLCLWLAGANDEMLFAGVLFATTPMASLYALFGGLNGFAKETSGAMLLATVLSIVPISLVLLLMAH